MLFRYSDEAGIKVFGIQMVTVFTLKFKGGKTCQSKKIIKKTRKKFNFTPSVKYPEKKLFTRHVIFKCHLRII